MKRSAMLIVGLVVALLSYSQGNYLDLRDSSMYEYTTIDDLDIMSTNIRYDITGHLDVYVHDSITYNRYYYEYKDYVNTCPTGWRLPNSDDVTVITSEYGSSGSYNLIPKRYEGFMEYSKALGKWNAIFNEGVNGVRVKYDIYPLSNTDTYLYLHKGGSSGTVRVSKNSKHSGMRFPVRCVREHIDGIVDEVIDEVVDTIVQIYDDVNFKTIGNLVISKHDAIDPLDGDILFGIHEIDRACPNGFQPMSISDHTVLFNYIARETELIDGPDLIHATVVNLDYLEDSLNYDFSGHYELCNKQELSYVNYKEIHWLSDSWHKHQFVQVLMDYNAPNKYDFHVSAIHDGDTACAEYSVRCVKHLGEVVPDSIYLVHGWNYVHFNSEIGNIDELVSTRRKTIMQAKTLGPELITKLYIPNYFNTIGEIDTTTNYMIKVNDFIKLKL